MSAGSFAELFLQYFSWGVYNLIWDVFVSLGIVYIPFGYYLFDAYTSSREKGPTKMTSTRVLKYLEMKIFMGIVVLTLAGVPTIPLNITDMKFNERVCTAGSSIATMMQKKPDATGTGTDYDTEFTTSNMGSLVTKIPVGWMAILSIGQAISDGVRIKIPCKSSLSQVAYELQINKINDPAVKQEVADFYQGCYRQARAKFDSEMPSGYTATMKDEDDAGWPGSSFFLNTSGYYDKMQPPEPVNGFIAFVGDTEERDKGVWNGQAPKPAWSKPYCKEWYENRLRQKIIDTINTSTWTDIKSEVASWKWLGGDVTKSENVMIRTLVEVSNIKNIQQSNPGQAMDGFGYDMGNAQMQQYWQHGVANAGTFAFGAAFYPTMVILKKALPLVHAFVLAGLTMFLPFLLILSQYGIKEVLAMSALFVSIKFWPVIWTVGQWMEATLQDALLPNLNSLQNTLLLGGQQAISLNDDVLDYVIGAWYLMGPLLLSTVMTMAGMKTGEAVQSAANASGTGKGAGQKGGQLAEQGVSKGMK